MVRGIAFRQRASMSQKTSIENSSPRQTSWTNEGTSVYARKKSSSSRFGGAMDVARAEALARFHEHRVAHVVRDLLGSPAARRRNPLLDEEAMRLELVGHARGRLRVGQEHEGGRESLALAREDREVEVVQRDDEANVVLFPQRGEGRHVRRIRDPRNDDVEIAVVERRRERIGVDAERCRTRDAGTP